MVLNRPGFTPPRPAWAQRGTGPVPIKAVARPILRPVRPILRPQTVFSRPTGAAGGAGGARPVSAQGSAGKAAILPQKVKAEPNEPEKVAEPSVQPKGKEGSQTGQTDQTGLKVVSLRKDTLGVKALLGEYAHMGENHGRRFYQRTSPKESQDVFLYYWDERDGDEQKGWWFGNELGGLEVWACHLSDAQEPPRRGWKVPWDNPNPNAPELIGVEPAEGESATEPTEPATEPPAAEASAREEVAGLEEKMRPVWARCTEALKDGGNLEELQQVLAKHQQSIIELGQRLQDQISEARKNAPKDVPALVKLQPTLRAIQARLATEQRKAKTQLDKPKAMQVKVEPESSKEAEAKTAPKTVPPKTVPPKVTEKPVITQQFVKVPKPAETEPTQTAESSLETEQELESVEEIVRDFQDSVGSILEMAEPLLKDPTAEPSAVEEVESSARDLEKQLPALRLRLTQLTQAVMKVPVAQRQKQLQSTQTLQTRLTEANKKLTPLRNFRAQFKEKAEAKQSTQNLENSLAEIELEVEKASMVLTLSSQVQLHEEEVQIAERSLKEASQSLAKWKSQLFQRLPNSRGAAADELRQLSKKGQEHQGKIDQLFQQIRAQRAGLQARRTVKEANEKVAQAEETLIKCSEAELPFLKGIEVLPKEESGPALAACDAAVKAASMAHAAASLFLKRKIAEVKKMAIESSPAEEMEKLRERAEDCLKKIEAFRKDTEERRANDNLAEVMTQMSKANAAFERLQKWGDICQQGLDAKLEDLKEALEEAPKEQKVLSQAMAEASKLLVTSEAPMAQKQDMKSRLATINQGAAKHRSAMAHASRLLKGKEQLEDQQQRTAQLEAQLMHLQEIGTSTSEMQEEQVMEEQKIMDTLQKSLQAALNAAQLRAANAEPTLKSALQKILERQRKVHTELNALKSTSKDRREKLLLELWQKGATDRLEQLQRLKAEAEEMEMPFLKGLEVLPHAEAAAALDGMEEAARKIEAGLQEARTYIAAKSLACKAMGVPREQLLTKNALLPPLQSWLVELRQTNVVRRKAAQSQAAEAKISELEKAVDSLVKEAEQEKSHAELLSSCAQQRQKVSAAEALAQEARKIKASKELQARLRRAEAKLESKVSRQLKDLERQVTASRLLGEVKSYLEEMDLVVSECQNKVKPALAPIEQVLCEEVMVEALLDHMKEKDWNHEVLFKDIASGKDTVAPEKLIDYVASLKPGAMAQEQKTAWLEDREGLVSLVSFKALVRRCAKCAVAGRLENQQGELLAELKPGDLLLILETKKDGKEILEVELPSSIVGLAVSKTKEKLQLLPCSSFDFHCEQFERQVQESLGKIQEKAARLGSEAKEVNVGPDEVRAELMKLTPKLQVPVAALSLLQKQIAVAKRTVAKAKVSERQRHLEVQHQNEAEEVVAEFARKVEAAEALAQELQSKLKDHLTQGLEQCERPVSLRKEAEQINSQIVSAAEDAKAVCARNPDKLKVARLKPRLTELSKRALKARKEGVAKIQILEKAIEALVSSLSTKLGPLLRTSPKTKEALKHLLKNLQISEEQQELLLDSLGGDELCELKLSELSQRYFVVQNPIAMTNLKNLNEAAAKTVRKLASGDLLELLDGPTESNGLQRVFARCVADGQEGWVTMEGNQGTSFLKDAAKPYYVSTKEEVQLDEEEKSSVKFGEVVELVQGPQSTTSSSCKAYGKATSDHAAGWFTVSDQSGNIFAEELPNLYKCISPVAMTEQLDIESKVTSRLSKGSWFLFKEGPTKDPTGALERMRGQIFGSTSEGWVTVKGNAGTVFLEPCKKHYAILEPTQLEKSRRLKVQEVVEVSDTKEETRPVEQRIKVKSTDGQIGWVRLHPSSWKLWSKHYTVRAAQSLKDKDKVLREVTKGEHLLALGLPRREEDVLKVRVRTKKDGLVGWVVVRDKQQLLDF